MTCSRGELPPHERGEKKVGRDGPSKDSCILLSKLFTAAHLRQLVWYGGSELLFPARDLVEREGILPWEPTVGQLFEVAFQLVHRHYPVEYVFKTYLLRRLLFGTHSPRTTSCFMEWPVGLAQADMLLVNGEATVFEIKSRFDTPTRLESQLQSYYKCFPNVVLVTEDGHEAEYLDTLPAHVGVFVLTRRGSISRRRAPSPHFGELRYLSLYALLRERERGILRDSLGLRWESSEPPDEFVERLSAKLSIDEWLSFVMRLLRDRKRTRRRAKLCNDLPESLHSAAFSYSLHQMEWAALLGVLSSPARVADKDARNVFSLPLWQGD